MKQVKKRTLYVGVGGLLLATGLWFVDVTLSIAIFVGIVIAVAYSLYSEHKGWSSEKTHLFIGYCTVLTGVLHILAADYLIGTIIASLGISYLVTKAK